MTTFLDNVTTYRGSRKALRLKSKKLSPESRKLPTAFRSMRCDGDEEVLIECEGKAVTAEDTCDSKYFAGVVCSGKTYRPISCNAKQSTALAKV